MMRFLFENLTNTPLIQQVVAWTSLSVRASFRLCRTTMYHSIQNCWMIMRQVRKESKCSSVTVGPWFAMASISAAPIRSTLVPY